MREGQDIKPRSAYFNGDAVEAWRADEKRKRDAMPPLARLVHDMTQEDARFQLLTGSALNLMKDPLETINTLEMLKSKSECAEYNALCDEMMKTFEDKARR